MIILFFAALALAFNCTVDFLNLRHLLPELHKFLLLVQVPFLISCHIFAKTALSCSYVIISKSSDVPWVKDNERCCFSQTSHSGYLQDWQAPMISFFFPTWDVLCPRKTKPGNTTLQCEIVLLLGRKSNSLWNEVSSPFFLYIPYISSWICHVIIAPI